MGFVNAFDLRAAVRKPAVVVLVLVLSVVVATALLSLTVLVALGKLPVDWPRLSDIGQSFGGISAVLTAVGLLAISWSAALQARQTKISVMQSARQMQFNLMVTALADPACARLFVPGEAGERDLERVRAGAYATSLLRYQQYMYVTGDITRQQTRTFLALEIFCYPAFRAHWREMRPLWTATHHSGRAAEFIRVASEALADAEAQAAAVEPPDDGQP